MKCSGVHTNVSFTKVHSNIRMGQRAEARSLFTFVVSYNLNVESIFGTEEAKQTQNINEKNNNYKIY